MNIKIQDILNEIITDLGTNSSKILKESKEKELTENVINEENLNENNLINENQINNSKESWIGEHHDVIMSSLAAGLGAMELRKTIKKNR